MSNDVTKPRKEYTEKLPDVTRNRAAVAGQREVRKGGTLYLEPLASMLCTTVFTDGQQSIQYSSQLTAEGKAKYNKYLSNAYFYGATGRTVSGLSGLIASKKPVKELQSNISYIEDDVNGKGQSLRDFTNDAVNEAFVSTWSGVLVARPNTPEGSSRLDEEVNNLRPKLLHYKFESIINWNYETINNEEKLSLLVLVEATTKRDGFDVSVKKQYRVLELVNGIYHQSLYDDKGQVLEDAEPVIFNGKPSTEIPFYWIIAETKEKSVIDDLEDANFEHYNIYADYGAKLHYSSFIIYYETGVTSQSNNMVIGNAVKWNGGVDAEFGVLQPDGNADSHRLALQDTEQRMAALGAEALKPRTSGAESAEAKSLDKVAQNSTTANVAITVSDAVTKALNFATEMMGGSGDNIYMLNTDYNPSGMNSQDLTALVAAWQGGAISYDTFYENIQKGEIASNDRTAQDEQELIETTGFEFNGGFDEEA